MSETERSLEVKVVQKMPAGFSWDDVKGSIRVVNDAQANLLSRVGTITREIEKLETEMEPLRDKLSELQKMEDDFTTQAQQTIVDAMNQFADRQKVLEDTKKVLYKVVGAGNETVAAIVNELKTKPGKPSADKKLNKALEVLHKFPEVEAQVSTALDEMVKQYAKEEETVTDVIALVSKDWAKKTDKQRKDIEGAEKEKLDKEAASKKHDYEESVNKSGIVAYLGGVGLLGENTQQLTEGVWGTITQAFTKIKEAAAKSIKNMLTAKTVVQDYVSALEDAAKGMLAEEMDEAKGTKIPKKGLSIADMKPGDYRVVLQRTVIEDAYITVTSDHALENLDVEAEQSSEDEIVLEILEGPVQVVDGKGKSLHEENADFDKMVLGIAQEITNKTDEALDGDDVQRLALMFWVELDFNQGNLTDKEYEERMAKAKQGVPFGPTKASKR